MLSKLLRTQVPETYKRAHPTPAEELMARLKSLFTKRGLKQVAADYRLGCEVIAEEKRGGRPPTLFEAGHPLNRAGGAHGPKYRTVISTLDDD
ncbi:hypothetical protein SAMN05660831_00030 [Thiohalospira halophila DSM 15071]|uniref:Uncharacterized protein n=1 Tax=Thiohalospira halophila DSM 15071 TaxID=1123397 RepID=A0A1I1N6P8_9GAMM|nr:hypothetical protein [Thiohalospira halophila]SFC90483.1 hypothetical protein SAMN05660831_00030 [Thiohalospira halophila DSM 15071]